MKSLNYAFKFLVFLCAVTQFVQASPELDERYRFHRIAYGVIGAGQMPLYRDAIEKELARTIRTNPRFELADKATSALKSLLQKNPKMEEFLRQGKDVKELSKFWEALKASCDALFLISISRTDELDLSAHLINIASHEWISKGGARVTDPNALQSVSLATRKAVNDAIIQLPFEGTVLSRQDETVVLDISGFELIEGQTLQVFTVEDGRGGLKLDYIGRLSVNQSEENISFAKIMWEKEPFAVKKNAKVRSAPNFEGKSTFLDTDDKRQMGYLDFGLGGGFFSFTTTSPGGATLQSNVALYPAAVLGGEVWLTSRLYWDARLDFALSGFGTAAPNGNGSTSNFHRLSSGLGYRFYFGSGARAASVHLKAGYSRSQFENTGQPALTLFPSVTHSAIFIGGGAELPLTERIGVGFTGGASLFGSVSETPIVSGTTVTGTSGWNFLFRGYYALSPEADLDFKLLFQQTSASFTGGTSDTRTTQIARVILLGLNYYL